ARCMVRLAHVERRDLLLRRNPRTRGLRRSRPHRLRSRRIQPRRGPHPRSTGGATRSGGVVEIRVRNPESEARMNDGRPNPEIEKGDMRWMAMENSTILWSGQLCLV